MQRQEEIQVLRIQEDLPLQLTEVNKEQTAILDHQRDLHQQGHQSKEALQQGDHLQWEEEIWLIMFYQIIHQVRYDKFQTREVQMLQVQVLDLFIEILPLQDIPDLIRNRIQEA